MQHVSHQDKNGIFHKNKIKRCDTTEIRTLAPEGTGLTVNFRGKLAGQRDNHSAIVPMDDLWIGGSKFYKLSSLVLGSWGQGCGRSRAPLKKGGDLMIRRRTAMERENTPLRTLQEPQYKFRPDAGSCLSVWRSSPCSPHEWLWVGSVGSLALVRARVVLAVHT